MAEARDVEACWRDMNADEKRRIVESLVKRITIAKDEIKSSFCYLPACSWVHRSDEDELRREGHRAGGARDRHAAVFEWL